jgi:hypothetical protein
MRSFSLKEFISRQWQIMLSKLSLKGAIICVLPAGESAAEFVDKIMIELRSLMRCFFTIIQEISTFVLRL